MGVAIRGELGEGQLEPRFRGARRHRGSPGVLRSRREPARGGRGDADPGPSGGGSGCGAPPPPCARAARMRGCPRRHHYPRSCARRLAHLQIWLPAPHSRASRKSSSPCPFLLPPPPGGLTWFPPYPALRLPGAQITTPPSTVSPPSPRPPWVSFPLVPRLLLQL